MSVDDRHPSPREEPPQRPDRAEIERVTHAHGDHGDAGGLGFAQEAAAGLDGEQGLPAVVGEPAGLGEDADLLAAETRRGFGVQDDPRAG